MDFLKRLFGGSGGDVQGNALYVYVKPHRCDDVLELRINLNNDLSLNDTGDGYWVRKLASSSNYKCNQVEVTLYFDMNRRLQDKEISGGAWVSREDYEIWQAAHQPE